MWTIVYKQYILIIINSFRHQNKLPLRGKFFTKTHSTTPSEVLSCPFQLHSSTPSSRIAAKIKLGTVTISPDPGHDPDKFVLNKVIVMKARGSAMMGLPSAAYTPNVFYGGMAGDKSTVKAYLSETI